MPTGESMIPVSPRGLEQGEKSDFTKWITVFGQSVIFNPENMPLKAYDAIKFYEYKKSTGLTDENPEMESIRSKFKAETGCDLAEFMAYYEKMKEEAARQ